MSKDRSITPTKKFAFDQDTYKHFVDEIELHDIKLTEFEFRVKPEYFFAVREEKEEDKDILSRSFKREIVSLHYEKEDEIFFATIAWNLTIKRSNKKVLHAKAEYLVVYDNAPAVEREYVERFTQKVVPFATYPYFREKVADFSWASGAELPVMPVLKIK